jgi:hypothetical protein
VRETLKTPHRGKKKKKEREKKKKKEGKNAQ